ncbi:hypothetical protein [Nocardia thraciensis]
MTRIGEWSTIPEPRTPRRWSKWWIVLYFLAGIVAATATFESNLAAWDRCAVDPEAGGSFAIMARFAAALVVMPLVGAATGIMAVVANALLLRNPHRPRLTGRVPLAITLVGAGVLLYLMNIWIAAGVPPEGYCDMR